MKKIIFVSIIASLGFGACVQPSKNQKVTFNLTVAGKKNIEKVGVRGEGKPFSWRNDLEMTEVIKDSVYSLTVNQVTGYKFVECKFTVNEEFELQEQENRKVVFEEDGTTTVNAVYNVK